MLICLQQQQWIFLGSSRKRIQIELTRCTWHKHRFGLKEFLWQKCMNLYTCATCVNDTIHTIVCIIHTGHPISFWAVEFRFFFVSVFYIQLHLGLSETEIANRDIRAYKHDYMIPIHAYESRVDTHRTAEKHAWTFERSRTQQLYSSVVRERKNENERHTCEHSA